MAAPAPDRDRSRAKPRGARVTLGGISKVFPARGRTAAVAALDGIDLDVEPGSFVSILGPSGCGKTTLLRIVAGLERATAGRVTIDGTPVSGPFTDAGVVFQSDLLLPWRPTLGNVLLQAEMRGLPEGRYRARARELLAMVGLTDFESHYPSELSGGMRQRVSLSRALLLDFPLLLMDEPFGALDALTRDQLALDLQKLVRDRATVLFVTHSVDEAIFLSDRVVVMTPRPGVIQTVLDIALPRPRRFALRATPEFDHYATVVRDVFLRHGVLRED